MKIFTDTTALSEAHLEDGQLVRTLGGTTEGDNKAGIYYIEPNTYTAVGEDITLANTNIARWLTYEEVDVIPDYNQSGVIIKNTVWMADSTGGAVTRNTPSNPQDGDKFWIKDDQQNALVENINLGYNGSETIMGLAENMQINIQGVCQGFVYKAVDSDWRLL